MDPRLVFGTGSSVPVVGIPGFPTQTTRDWRPKTVTEGVPLDAKRNLCHSMMTNPLSIRDMIGVMAESIPVAQDAFL